MSKLKITRKQYNSILLHEQKSRLEASGEIIVEKTVLDTQAINESWREVVLGVAQILGVGLTGHNKILAQDALKNDSIMGEIKATLEDEDKLKELVDAFEAKGMKDPSKSLSTKAEKVIDTFNQISINNHLKHKLDTKVVNNLQALTGDKGKDYDFNDADVTVDSFKKNPDRLIKIQDTLEIKIDDKIFVGDGFTLTPKGTDIITLAIKEIEKQGGGILGIEVETSTDSQPTLKFVKKVDHTGNIVLAHLRSKSVANLINTLDGSISLTHREIPNNGSNVVNSRDFQKYRTDKKIDSLKEKTKEFRYIKLIITAIFESQEEDIEPPEVIKKYRGEIIKVIKSASENRDLDAKIEFKKKKWKCSTDDVIVCSTF